MFFFCYSNTKKNHIFPLACAEAGSPTFSCCCGILWLLRPLPGDTTILSKKKVAGHTGGKKKILVQAKHHHTGKKRH
jgi:hypothetical protein